MSYGRPPPKGRLYSTLVVSDALGFTRRSDGMTSGAVKHAVDRAKVRPYVNIKNARAFDVMGIGVWRRWPLDLTERLLETTAENLRLKGDDTTQRRIDKEVERWRTETATNDTQ